MIAPAPRRRAGGWRALGWFWAIVALAVLGLVGGLAWLGPPAGEPAVASRGAAGGSPAFAPAGERHDNGASPAGRAETGPRAPAPRAAVPAADLAGGAAPAAAGPEAGSPPAPGRESPAGGGAVAVPAAATAGAAAPVTAPPAPEPPPLAALAAAPAGGRGEPPRGPMLAGSGPRPIPPPDPALLEERPGGVRLPRIAPDGRTAFRAYAQAGFDRADTRPRVAVVLAGIGLSASDTGEAIRRLPPAVTLALNPYAPRLDPVAERARERGMETLVAVPMESAGYPLADPGDKALLTGLSLAENLNRLDWALARAAGYVGVLGGLGPLRGERFAQLADLLGPVQDVLCARGLLYVDSRPGAPHPARAWGRAVDVVLDEPATRGEIERRLAELERLARENGSALGLAGDPAPVVVERLAAWAAGLEARGLVLAPLTAVIRRPERARCAGGGPPVAAGFPVPAPAPPPASPSPR